MSFTSRTTTASIAAAIALAAGLSACSSDMDAYEAGVKDYEPTYCYAALGGTVECYRKPVPGEERRLVNYYGKSPARYDKPPAPEPATYNPPPKVDTWVKDAEPLVRAMPKGDISDRPWLQPGYAEPAPHQASTQATQALLREANENLTRSIQADSQKRLKALQDAREPAASPAAAAPAPAGWPESSLRPVQGEPPVNSTL